MVRALGADADDFVKPVRQACRTGFEAYVGQRTDKRRRSAYTRRLHNPGKFTRMSNAIAAHKHRARLHILRDRVKRALRDAKRGMTGAAERVTAHRAKRSEYRAANP
ncbi:MAG TPA: hypothetical protein VLA16_25955 [Ideonella sp.]|nr:hypothetical protein [Ideonella sp.]